MYGIDVSHWQGKIDWNKVGSSDIKFAFIKCSEGVGWVDPTFKQNKDQARKAGVLCGFYHFANHNDPIKEAEWFMKSVREIQAGELLALDAETGQSPEWCKKFLDRASELAGFKLMLYAPVSHGGDWSAVCKADYGLWIARYASNKIYIPYYVSPAPKIAPWSFYAIWQYSSKGSVSGISGNVDMNYSKMELDVLKKYGKPRVDECIHCPIHCPK